MSIDQQDNYYLVKRNLGMRIAWFFVSVFLIGFGSVPWLILATKQGGNVAVTTHWPAILFMAIWSSLAWSVSIWLLFHALARIEILAIAQTLVLIRTVGPAVRRKQFHDVARAYYIRRWFHKKNGPDREEQCLVIRYDDKKTILLTDLESSDLTGAFDWLRQATVIDTVDWRRQKVFG